MLKKLTIVVAAAAALALLSTQPWGQRDVQSLRQVPVAQSGRLTISLDEARGNQFHALSDEKKKQLLTDPFFLERMSEADPSIRGRYFDEWMDGFSDNFCRQFLSDIAMRTYDAEGLRKLNLKSAQASCPKGVELKETLDYVNKRLADAFDDPWTHVLPPQDAKAMTARLANMSQIEGVGLLFSIDRSRTMAAPLDNGKPHEPQFEFTGNIYHVVGGGPAEKAGIADGDQLIKVDGQSVLGGNFDHVIKDLLMGKAGTSVKLTLKRGDTEYERTVTRGNVPSEPVWLKDLGDGYYSIIVNTWSEGVSGKMLQLLEGLRDNGARGIIIDERNNGGGLWDEAVFTASYNVKNGVLVSSRERITGSPDNPRYQTVTWERKNGALYRSVRDESTGKVSKPQRVTVTKSWVDGKTFEQKSADIDVPFIEGLPPMVVLINGMSASASEVTAGALSQNRIIDEEHNHFEGATLIGELSFGKGIEQANGPAPNYTRLSVTIGRYFLKDGQWPGDAYKHRNGVKPEIVVEEPLDAQYYKPNDAQVNSALDFLKSKNHKSAN